MVETQINLQETNECENKASVTSIFTSQPLGTRMDAFVANVLLNIGIIKAAFDCNEIDYTNNIKSLLKNEVGDKYMR